MTVSAPALSGPGQSGARRSGAGDLRLGHVRALAGDPPDLRAPIAPLPLATLSRPKEMTASASGADTPVRLACREPPAGWRWCRPTVHGVVRRGAGDRPRAAGRCAAPAVARRTAELIIGVRRHRRRSGDRHTAGGRRGRAVVIRHRELHRVGVRGRVGVRRRHAAAGGRAVPEVPGVAGDRAVRVGRCRGVEVAAQVGAGGGERGGRRRVGRGVASDGERVGEVAARARRNEPCKEVSVAVTSSAPQV